MTCHTYCGPGSSVGIATELPGWTVRRSNPGGGARFSAPVQTGPGAHPASCKMSTGSFPGVKSGRGVTLTPHALLVPWLRKSRAIPLLPRMGRTACTEPQGLQKGAHHLYFCYMYYITPDTVKFGTGYLEVMVVTNNELHENPGSKYSFHHSTEQMITYRYFLTSWPI